MQCPIPEILDTFNALLTVSAFLRSSKAYKVGLTRTFIIPRTSSLARKGAVRRTIGRWVMQLEIASKRRSLT